MLCLLCSNQSEFIFCPNCSPRYGEIVESRNRHIFVGEFPFWRVLKSFFSGKKIIKWWVGSDVLLLLKFPPGRGKLSVLRHRLKMRILEPFISRHWINGYRLLKALEDVPYIPFRKCQLQFWVGRDTIVEKVPHEGFNVFYYSPGDSVYQRWVYGLDIIEKLIYIFPHFNWVKLDGKIDMKSAFKVMDIYIRPSRWDGFPRLVREAALNDIPVIFSENFDLTVEDCADQLRAIYAKHPQPLVPGKS